MARWLPRDVRPFDVGFALLLGAAMTVVTLWFPLPRGTLFDLRHTALLVCTALGTVILMVRRRHPVASTALVAGLSLAYPGNWFVFAALYAAGAYARPRSWLWVLVPLVVGCAFVGEQGWIGFRPNDHAFVAFMTTLFALAGLYVGTRRTLIAAATERADRAEREQELLAEQARAEERARLAAEMHDVVTHRVNLMVLQAGALGVQAPDPTVRDAAENVRACGVQALAELRDLVGVLRAGGDPSAADPGADRRNGIAALVDESRSVGVDVGLTERGDPDVLAPTVHRTLVRVVQEALTNARKHAPGARVDVDLRYDEHGAAVDVVNAAPTGAEPELAGSGGGTGLAGLRRRVAMVGGTFAAGPGAAGGFAVRALLPAYVPTAEEAVERPVAP